MFTFTFSTASCPEFQRNYLLIKNAKVSLRGYAPDAMDNIIMQSTKDDLIFGQFQSNYYIDLVRLLDVQCELGGREGKYNQYSSVFI